MKPRSAPELGRWGSAMSYRHVLFILLFLGLFSQANAEQRSCGQYVGVFGFPTSNCQCHGVAHKAGIPSSYLQLKLVAICDFREERYDDGTHIFGNFYFKGDQVFTGVLTREESDFITEFTFTGAQLPKMLPLTNDSVVSFRFENPDRARQIFRAPPITPKRPCVESRVKIRVTEVLVFPGDNDHSASYARKYQALEVGPYRRCQRR